MIRARASITIRRDSKEVFDFLSDVTSHSEWINEVLESAAGLEEPIQVGSRFTQEIGIGARHRVSAQFEVLELVEDQRLTIRSIRGLPPTRKTFSVSPDGDGTRVTYAEETDPRGLYFKLISPIAKLYAQRRLKGDLRSLRDKLEGREEGHAGDAS